MSLLKPDIMIQYYQLGLKKGSNYTEVFIALVKKKGSNPWDEYLDILPNNLNATPNRLSSVLNQHDH